MFVVVVISSHHNNLFFIQFVCSFSFNGFTCWLFPIRLANCGFATLLPSPDWVCKMTNGKKNTTTKNFVILWFFVTTFVGIAHCTAYQNFIFLIQLIFSLSPIFFGLAHPLSISAPIKTRYHEWKLDELFLVFATEFSFVVTFCFVCFLYFRR